MFIHKTLIVAITIHVADYLSMSSNLLAHGPSINLMRDSGATQEKKHFDVIHNGTYSYVANVHACQTATIICMVCIMSCRLYAHGKWIAVCKRCIWSQCLSILCVLPCLQATPSFQCCTFKAYAWSGLRTRLVCSFVFV